LCHACSTRISSALLVWRTNSANGACGGPIGTLPVDLFSMYYDYMARKLRSRPATGQDPVTAVRLPAELKSKIDTWANRQKDKPSLSEAIRQLLEKAVAGTAAPSQSDKGRTRLAANLAAREIDQLGDKAATGEERASRKRRLLSGPKEFRDMRRK
jgi:Arc/MetJ-type ribon-helix-helix transcriptional regulator